MTYASAPLHRFGQSAQRARSIVRGSPSPSAPNPSSRVLITLLHRPVPRLAKAEIARSSVKNTCLRASGARGMTLADGGAVAADETLGARAPKTRLTLIGMTRSPFGGDFVMPATIGQALPVGPVISSKSPWITTIAAAVSVARGELGSMVVNSALAASIERRSDAAKVARSSSLSVSAYAPTASPRAIFAADAVWVCKPELLMSVVYSNGHASSCANNSYRLRRLVVEHKLFCVSMPPCAVLATPSQGHA